MGGRGILWGVRVTALMGLRMNLITVRVSRLFPQECRCRKVFLSEIYPEDPAVLKTLRDGELLRHSVFTMPPDLPRCEPFFERKNVCNSQENGVRTRCAAIAIHYAIVNLLRRVNLLQRSIFSTAGSFGYVQFVQLHLQELMVESKMQWVLTGLRQVDLRPTKGKEQRVSKGFLQGEVLGEVCVLEGGSPGRSFWQSLWRSFWGLSRWDIQSKKTNFSLNFPRLGIFDKPLRKSSRAPPLERFAFGNIHFSHLGMPGKLNVHTGTGWRACLRFFSGPLVHMIFVKNKQIIHIGDLFTHKPRIRKPWFPNRGSRLLAEQRSS